MWDDFLYEQIQKTLILPENLKQEILLHWDKIGTEKRGTISNLIKSENTLLLNFLKKQKDGNIIPVSDFKKEYLAYRKEKRNQQEEIEKAKEEEQLVELLENM